MRGSTGLRDIVTQARFSNSFGATTSTPIAATPNRNNRFQ